MMLKFRQCVPVAIAFLALFAPRANMLAQSSAKPATPSAIRGEAIQPAAAPGTNAAVKAPSPAPNVPATAGGYESIGFEKLASYEYTAPDTQVTNLPPEGDVANKCIPDNIKKMDGKLVQVRGFMLPLKIDAGYVTEFLIMRNQSACCFGTAPKLTEIVDIKLTGKGVDAIMDQPVTVKGRLHVGTVREDGYITCIYKMDGEKLIENPGN